MKYVPSRKVCEILGVHPNTVRRWANEKKIRYIKTQSGQRRYDVDTYLGETKEKRKVCYCRVSSAKQKDDLARQIKYMKERYPGHEIIQDVGSGINFKRKGLLALLERIDKGEIVEVVVAHRDRLSRFGYELIQWFIEKNGGKLVVLDNIKDSPKEELTKDLISIIHVFSCRLHGLRKYREEIEKDTLLPK